MVPFISLELVRCCLSRVSRGRRFSTNSSRMFLRRSMLREASITGGNIGCASTSPSFGAPSVASSLEGLLELALAVEGWCSNPAGALTRRAISSVFTREVPPRS